MLLSEWRKTAPNRECMSSKVLAVLKPVLADLGAAADPACWVLWGEDPEFRYSVMAPTQAGLITVAVRVSGAGSEGPRATGKLVRWGKLQVSELGLEAADGHRIVAVQVEGQVLKGVDDEADRICEFLLGLLAGIDGRAYQVTGPVVVQVAPEPQVVAISKPAVVAPEAPGAGAKPGLKAVPRAGRDRIGAPPNRPPNGPPNRSPNRSPRRRPKQRPRPRTSPPRASLRRLRAARPGPHGWLRIRSGYLPRNPRRPPSSRMACSRPRRSPWLQSHRSHRPLIPRLRPGPGSRPRAGRSGSCRSRVSTKRSARGPGLPDVRGPAGRRRMTPVATGETPDGGVQ